MNTTWKDRWLYRPHPLVVAAVLVISLLLLWQSTRTPGEVVDAETRGIMIDGVIEKIISEEDAPSLINSRTTRVQHLLVRIHEPTKGDRTITVQNDLTPLEVGDSIYVNALSLNKEGEEFNILDVKRSGGLAWLFAGFVALVLLVSGKKGINAIVGLLFSIAVIFAYAVPTILQGGDPVVTGLLTAGCILLGTFYVSHGFDGKSISALIGIIVTLILVGILGKVVVDALHFTGFGDENAIYLTQQTDGLISLVSLTIAGIIIAAIGVLDDVAITQSSTVYELAKASPVRGWKLFRHAMRVGTDHISGVINTLVLAYAGASLPLILLLQLSNFPLGFTLGGEMIAEEIVRTLVSSAGLVLAVPLTTAIAVFFVNRTSERSG